MSRRDFLKQAATAAMLWPGHVRAQQPQAGPAIRIAWLSNDRPGSSAFADFQDGLRKLGYVPGRNIAIETRWAEGSAERMKGLAAEVAQSKHQIVVAHGGLSLIPLLRANPAMPVVFVFSGDPLEAKIVDSYARPGRNATGISFLSLDLVGKRMELLKEALPTLQRVAIIANPEHAGEQSELRVSQKAAKAVGIAIDYFQARTTPDIEAALNGVLKTRSEAIMVFPDAFTMRHSELFAQFAARHRVPAASGWAQFVDGGNLLSYGPNMADSFRRLAVFVDKVLKGANPSDVPIEFPTAVELVVNLKAARATGVTIPQSILLRANRVIE